MVVIRVARTRLTFTAKEAVYVCAVLLGGLTHVVRTEMEVRDLQRQVTTIKLELDDCKAQLLRPVSAEVVK